MRVKAEVNISAAAASIPLRTGSGVTETKDGPKRRNKENKTWVRPRLYLMV